MKEILTPCPHLHRRWRSVLLFLLWSIAPWSHAQTPVFEIEIREHLFFPAELVIPANQKVKLIILIPEVEDIEEEEWLSAIQNNEAFDFLHDPEEDIYSIEDGRPIEKNAV